MRTYDIVIIGGGPAGLAAARGVFTANPALSVALIERDGVLGGILNQCAHKGFGLTYFGEELTGVEYARRYLSLCERLDADIFTETSVMAIGADRVLTVSGPTLKYSRIKAKAVILASGCRERPVGALPVSGQRPSGVFTAGAAQKMINVGGYHIGERAVILGSGDVGLIVARELALRNRRVIAVIEKEDRCGGLPRNYQNCLVRFGIPLITKATISEVIGMPRISGVRAESEDGQSRFIECDTLITSVGLIPERDLLKDKNAAAAEWIFVAGNAAYVHDLVDDVTAESERAGELAAAYIKDGVRNSRADSAAKSLSADTKTDAPICVACPKGCRALWTGTAWTNLACGRKEPELAY